MYAFINGPINTVDGWVAAPLNKKAARDMNVPSHPAAFFKHAMTPEEMHAMEYSHIAEKMKAKTGIFLDISETEQPYVEPNYIGALIEIVTDELKTSIEPLKTALEKTLSVLNFAKERKTGVVFWF